ncbi:MAG TPA: transglutaminase-like domain-containing protein, partial [bacterium]|nr:transglutaminase-like domain-containing protein [bacterium]
LPEPVFKKGFGDTGDRSYVWENRNIPKFKPEPLMGSELRYRGHVEMQLAYWNTWNGFARDIYEVTFKPVLDDMSTKDSQRIKSKVEDLTSGVSDTLEKIKILTRFVQTFGYSDTANYFGHAIKPNEIGLILDREYGDCKDHALVLTAMLREIGVKAHPVLTAAYDTSGVDPKFVTDIFNHVIVKVILEGGQTLLLDPTSRFTQFGKLPEMDEDTYILEIKPKNDEKDIKIKLEKTPVSSFSDNLIEKKVSGSIENGIFKYDVSVKFTGHAAEQGRYMLENADRISIEKIIRGDLLYYLYNAKIGDIKIENMNDTDAPLFLKYSLTLKLPENSGIPVVPVVFFNDPVYPNYVYSEDRTKPLIVPSVYSTLETYEMVFDPEKFTVSVPEKIEDNEFSEDDINSWKITVKNSSGRISLTAGFAQKGKKVETEKIPSLLKKVTGFSDLRRKMSMVSIIPYVEKPSPDVVIEDENKTDSTLEKAGEK